MDIEQISTSIAFVLACGAAGFERFKSNKAAERERQAKEESQQVQIQHSVNEQILKGKDELFAIAKSQSEEWKKKYDLEHDEFLSHRKAAHDHLNEVTKKMLNLSEENSQLKIKTDLTPVLQHHEKQNQINDKFMEAFSQILGKLEKINK